MNSGKRNNEPREDTIHQIRRRIFQTWTIPLIPILVAAYVPLKTYRAESGLMSLGMGISMFLLFRIRFCSPVPLPTLTVREAIALLAGFFVQISLFFFDLPNLRLVLIFIIIGYFTLRIAYLDLRALLFPSQFLASRSLDNTSA
jgi:tellurite resistance protein TehA-like permease